MKICPKCEKENPSSANCCMYCGAVLSEEDLDENARLQRALNNANKTITFLEQSLAVEQEKSKKQDSEADKAEIQTLQTQLLEEKEKYQNVVNEKEQQWSYLNAQLDTVKKQKKSGGWGWIFVIMSIILAAILIDVSQRYTRLEKEKSDYLHEKNSIKDEKNSMQSELNELRYKYKNLIEQFDDLREIFPLKITKIELGNANSDGTIIDDFGSTLYSSGLRYLKPKIYFTNYLKESKVFNFTINYYNARGQLKYNTSDGNRPSSENYILATDSYEVLSGWGNESANSWSSGSYTIEIWSDGVCLGSKNFMIYN